MRVFTLIVKKINSLQKMTTPYTQSSNVLCIPCLKSGGALLCPNSAPVLGNIQTNIVSSQITISSYQDWIGATISVLLSKTDAPSAGSMILPSNLDINEVPDTITPFILTITRILGNSTAESGVVKFTLPNGCSACSGYYKSGP
jgi:hypothetical protein